MRRVAHSESRTWVVLLSLVLTGVIATVTAAHLEARRRPTRTDQGGAGIVVALEEPAWRVTTRPAGLLGRIRKKERERAFRQERSLLALLDDVYGALLLGEGNLEDVAARRFTRGSGKSLLASSVRIPNGSRDVRVLRRKATIGVKAPGGNQAAARVVLLIGGRVGGRNFQIRHRSTLWLHRSAGEWRVIAFDMRQVPA